MEFAVDRLQKLGLIDRNDEVISVHRLVQSGFVFQKDSDRQSAFENTAFVINRAFPKQIKGRWPYGEWDECQANVQHVLALAEVYNKMRREKNGVKSTQNFVEVLSNCAW